MESIEARLKRRHGAVIRSIQVTADKKAELLETIREARQAGWAVERIGYAMGITKARAWQLVRQADGRGRSSR